MPIMVSAPESKDYTPAPQGLHRAVCVDVWEPYKVENTKFPNEDGSPKIQTKTRLVFLLDAQMEDGRPFEIAPLYTMSLHEKSTLRKNLESWRGRSFTPQELAGFDLETVIGANCQMQVVHNKVGDRTYANVSAIVPLSKDQPKLTIPPGYIRHKDKKPKAQAPSQEGPEDWEDDTSVPF